MAAPMASHRCGMPLNKMSKAKSKAKDTIGMKGLFDETLPDPETGLRDTDSHTYHPDLTHLNINMFPEGVSNREELIDWYNDQYETYRSTLSPIYKSKIKDKETGDYKKDENGEYIYIDKKRPQRKNPVFGFCGVIKPPAAIIGELDVKDQIEYFTDAIEIINQILQEGHRRSSINSFQIHFDEGSGTRPEGHLHYQGLAFNDEGECQGKYIANPITNEQMNYTFCLRMQERGWPVEISSARPHGKEFEVTADMTPEQKHAVRAKARKAQYEERERRGTLDAVGLDTNQYDKYMKAKREAEAKAEQKAQEAKTQAAKKVDAAEDTMDEAINLQAAANEKVWKAEQKETELNQIQSNLNAKESQLDSRENALIKRERILKQAFDWMQNTFELEGTRHSMSVWDFYQASLGTRSSKSETKQNEVKETPKPENKVVEQKQVEEQNKQSQDMQKALLEAEGAWNESDSENKKKYTKQQFKKLWVATQDYRAELDKATQTRMVLGSKDVYVRDDNQARLQKNAEKVMSKYAKKLSGEGLLFGVVELGLKLPKELISKFVEGFKEGFQQTVGSEKPVNAETTKQEIHDDVRNEINEIANKETETQKTVERREKVNRDLVDDKYKSQRDIQIGV